MRKKVLWSTFGILAIVSAWAALINGREYYERYVPIVRVFSFLLDSELQDCLGDRYSVYGRVGRMVPTELTSYQKYRQAIISLIHRNFGEPKDIFVELAYSLPMDMSKSDLQLQDVSLTLPQSFHDDGSYELSCQNVATGEYFVFRKYSRKMLDQNYREPAVNLLPKNCRGAHGTVSVRMKNDAESKELINILGDSIFRAVSWNREARFTHERYLDIYLQKRSFFPGEDVELRAHAYSPFASGTVDIYRSGNPNSVLHIEGIELKPQKVDAYSYRDGLQWPITRSFKIPEYLQSGYYVAVLTQMHKSTSFAFVVKPLAKSKPKVVLIAATNTWNAYNSWGGGSFYLDWIGKACLNTDYATLISDKRPDANQSPLNRVSERGDHLYPAERSIALWLENNSIDYGIYSDDDLNTDMAILDELPILILPSHPEYYTEAMHDEIAKHVERGGNIISLGGNVMYYRVARSGDKMEKHENGRLYDMDQKFGGFWSRHLLRSPSRIFGSEYDARDWNTFAPYKVVNSTHPIFANTALHDGDLFGQDGSGLEMDVLQENTELNATLLATGTNPGGYGASMSIVEHPSGSKVFSVGSISFAYSLMRDERLSTILKNVFDLMERPN